MKTGRNDPCPCGSGKKFKHCCMLKDRAATVKERTLRQEESAFMERLYRFSQSPIFRTDLSSAFELFWNNNQAPYAISALTPLDMARFFDWYTTDYRTSQGRERIIDLFSQAESSQLSPLQRSLLEARQASRLCLYRLLDVDTGTRVLLLDLLRSGQQSVLDNTWSRLAKPGDLLLTRVIALPDRPHLDTAAALLPAQAEEPLKDYAQAQFDHFSETRYTAAWDDFLRDASYLFNHYLLGDQAESWRAATAPASNYYDGLRVRERIEKALEQKALADESSKAKTSQASEESGQVPDHSPIMLPGDLRRTPPTQQTEQAKDFKVSSGGVLLPQPAERDEDEPPPTIILPH